MIVEPIVEAVEHLALAGAVRAVDQQQNGFVLALGKLELRVEQSFAQRLGQSGELLLVEPVRQADGIKHERLQKQPRQAMQKPASRIEVVARVP